MSLFPKKKKKKWSIPLSVLFTRGLLTFSYVQYSRLKIFSRPKKAPGKYFVVVLCTNNPYLHIQMWTWGGDEVAEAILWG